MKTNSDDLLQMLLFVLNYISIKTLFNVSVVKTSFWVWGFVMATVSPASIKTLVQKVRKNRGADEENDHENLIEICSHLLKEIKELSSHKGITDSIF